MARHVWQTFIALLGGVAMFSIKWPLELVPVEFLQRVGAQGLYKLELVESFVVSALVGAAMMRVLNWRYRILAIVAVPAILMVWFPYQVSRGAQEHFGPEYTFSSYFWNHFIFFAPNLVGAIVGAAITFLVSARKSLNAA